MKLPSKSNHTFLVIDQGNTLTKVALFGKDGLVFVRQFSTFTASDINSLGIIQEEISAGIISSVSSDPRIIKELFTSVDWLILDHKTPLPVTNNYSTPETLGKDRIAAVVAAASVFPDKDVLVIDAGTAITYDLISKDKIYIGGSISPGLAIRLKALHTFTGRLPLFEVTVFDDLIGRDTYGSILSGVMHGAIFEINGFINEYERLYPGLEIILTGGDAIYFDKKLKSHIFASPNLVLNGLKLILQHNFEK